MTNADHAVPFLEDLTPRQIVAELDRHVIGQRSAKRAVAIALRNRWRRQQLPPEVAEEIAPKNILMIGPTGVGKTEIARRLAKLARAPFLKVEASKFTEVGYVGRDVESMVRDLVDIAVSMVRDERRIEVAEEARHRAEDRLLQLLVPAPRASPGVSRSGVGFSGSSLSTAAETLTETETTEAEPAKDDFAATREKFRERLQRGKLDDRKVEIEVDENTTPSFEMITPQGVEAVGLNLRDMMPGLFGKKRRTQVTVADARRILEQQEAEALIDRQQVAHEAIHRVEQAGILFLDEVDKICGREGARASGPDISREGVQRDLLPIVEGTTVNTKYGMVRTDHILFIGAGAFHVSKPSEMIPELQGRFPIRVELEALSEEDFVRILTEPRSALTRQYHDLLSTEGLEVSFTADGVREIARLAALVNSRTENIGARRLATMMERLLEEVSFEAPDMAGVRLELDKEAVLRSLGDIVEDRDVSRYVL